MSQQSAAYRKKWAYDRNKGVLRLIDSDPTREHVCQLLLEGSSVRGIADAAGVSPSVVSRLRLGQQHKIQRPVAAALLRVTTASIVGRPNSAGFVPKLGACRRIQALLAISWRHVDIDMAAGFTYRRSQLILNQVGDWVARDTYEAIVRVYDQLSTQPGPSARTRSRATKLGYAPPLAWDDETIDDPLARPQHQLRSKDRGGVDEAAIERRLAGDKSVQLTRAERWVVVRRLHVQGLDDQEIERRTGIDDRQVIRDRQRLGLPAVPQHTRGESARDKAGPRVRLVAS